MRKWLLISVLSTVFCLAPTVSCKGLYWIVTAVIKKVVNAMDLVVQRTQNETIKLQNAQKVIENALAKSKLKEIADWSKREKELFREYYDELWKVKNEIAVCNKVKTIMVDQKEIIAEYQKAISYFKKDKNISSDQFRVMSFLYTGIVTNSVRDIDRLNLAISSFNTQMSDEKRLEIIYSVAASVENNLSSLRKYTNDNIIYSLQRARNQNEIRGLKAYFGLN